jgi:predicted alpha/beta hydrolase family esterase
MTQQKRNVLTLPGWQGSEANHWQTLWEQRFGFLRVEQHNWMRPLRGDWVARLEEVVLEQEKPCVLVAHSLGCMLVASWAAYSRNTNRVQAALMVAPADTESAFLQGSIHGWTGIQLQKLPFKSSVIASGNDPFCLLTKAQSFAQSWGAEFTDVGLLGHINAKSELGDWPQGYEKLMQLIQQ